MTENQINNPLNKGDVIWMGYRKRTLWQWLTRKPSAPQYWRIMDDVTAGSVSRMEKCDG